MLLKYSSFEALHHCRDKLMACLLYFTQIYLTHYLNFFEFQFLIFWVYIDLAGKYTDLTSDLTNDWSTSLVQPFCNLRLYTRFFVNPYSLFHFSSVQSISASYGATRVGGRANGSKLPVSGATPTDQVSQHLNHYRILATTIG